MRRGRFYMKLGIVGLPNVGKSTLFNAITSTKNAAAANYPFCTIDPNTGVVPVPDARLDKLAEIWDTNKKTPAIVVERGLSGANLSRMARNVLDAYFSLGSISNTAERENSLLK